MQKTNNTWARSLAKWTLAVAVLLTATPRTLAQAVVESRISSMEMLIGQQVRLDLTVTADKDASVVFPETARIPEGVEVLGAIENPVEEAADNQLRHSRTYILTSFDDTLYYLPPMTVTVNGKDYQSSELALKVLPVEIDTLNLEKYYPAFSVQENPFLWSDWSASFWFSVLMLVMLAAAYYLYVRLREGKPVIASIRIVKRLLPHQKAMKAIEEIKAEKMVTAEDPKEYYTRLTDALRKYIEERYGFSAMEMTSSEIIGQLIQKGDKTMLEELRQLFETADLVKFAKYSTLINENDANLVSAIEFINKTKIETPPEPEPVPQFTEEQLRTKKNRYALKATIYVLLAGSLLLFVYISYNIYQLIA